MDNDDNLLERLAAILNESAARRTKARLNGQRPSKQGRPVADAKKPAKSNGLAAA